MMRTENSWAALSWAFFLSFRPRYWLATTAPPVARADNIWMIRTFRLSTRLTLDTAASPTPDTITVSASPMETLKNCSRSRGRSSAFSWALVNMGGEAVESSFWEVE